MDLNHQVKQEDLDDTEEMLIEPTTTTNYLKRVNNEHAPHQASKRACSNYTAQELNDFEQTLLQKCHKRGDVPTIYNPPFYVLQKPRPEHGDKVVARCCSCNVLLRGAKSITSNFIKHMKNSHPKIYLVYQRIKTLKSIIKLESPKHNQNKHYKTDPEMRANMSMDSICNGGGGGGALCDAGEQVSENTEYSATLSNYSNEDDIVEVDLKTGNSSYDGMQQHHIMNGNDDMNISFQMLNAMSNLLDEKLKVFITKAEFSDELKFGMAESLKTVHEHLTTKAIATTTSTIATTNSSDVSKLQEQVNRLEKECKELRTAMKKMQKSKHQMQMHLQSMDCKLNQCKIIIKNLHFDNDDSPQEAVEKLLHEQMELPNISVINVEVIMNNRGKNFPTKIMTATTNDDMQQEQQQQLCVELKSANEVNEILKNCCKLAKTGIRIKQQQSTYLRRQQSKLLVLRKEILKRNPTIKIVVRDFELIVEGVRFYWDDTECLCLSNYTTKEDDDLNAVSCLNRLADNDFTEFINFLEHYEVRVDK